MPVYEVEFGKFWQITPFEIVEYATFLELADASNFHNQSPGETINLNTTFP